MASAKESSAAKTGEPKSSLITKRVAYCPKHTTIKDLLSLPSDQILDSAHAKTFLIKGHIRSAKQWFVQVYDGTSPETLQLVLSKPQLEAIKKQWGSLVRSTTISAQVTIKASQGKGQKYDAHVVGDSFRVLGIVRDTQSFLPSFGRGVSVETWRDRADIRAHSPIMAAIFRIRSTLSHATHQFMAAKKILHLDPNTITGADAEGAGEMFIVTTFLEQGKSQGISPVRFD